MLFLFIFLNALPVPMLRQVHFQWFFGCVFSCCFWKGLFLVFLWFRAVLRVPREVILATFLDKIQLYGEKLGPSFLHTLTAFLLDFDGAGPPGGLKKQEKTAPGKSCFFGLKRKVPESIF